MNIINCFRVDLGERDLGEYLQKILSECGHSFIKIADKDKLSYVALDYKDELESKNIT